MPTVFDMKLRIHDDTIRLRLTRSEVGRIAAGLGVEAACRFPDGTTLRYALVMLPRAQAMPWATGNDAPLRRDRDAGLQILVEKDFACLDPRDGDDDADLYPNPRGATEPIEPGE